MYTNEYDIELHQLDNKMKEIKDKLDSIIQYDNSNNPYWSARDLMKILEYKKWEKFEELIQRSIKSCIEYGYNPMDHFPPGGKVIIVGKGANMVISDYILSKFACKLVCMNGDPVQKPIVAMAQAYFAIAINNYEDMIDKYYYDAKIDVINRSREANKRFTSTMYNNGIKTPANIATIKSNGDKAFFTYNSQEMKNKLGIPKNESLNDCLDPLPLSAKAYAMELSNRQIIDKQLSGMDNINNVHIDNNKIVRNSMIDNGYYPEQFSVQENFKKLEKRINKCDIDEEPVPINRSPFIKIAKKDE